MKNRRLTSEQLNRLFEFAQNADEKDLEAFARAMDSFDKEKDEMTEETEDGYIEIDSDLLLLAAEGGERNRAEAIGRIQEMTRKERALMRRALETLDEWFDADALDRHLKRD